MIVSLHVATGAAVGALVGSRTGAFAAGPIAHALGDLTPHEDFPSTAFEALTGAAGILLLARTRGPFHPTTLGAVAASLPDAEHLLHTGRRKLFPTHRFAGWHRRGGLPAWVQLAAAAVILALVASRGRD